MSDDSAPPRELPPIDLVRYPDFTLGDMQVRPSTLEVVSGERREVLEPRVMQVLVALYLARRNVVSRDDLISQCWEGRIVSDDAVNRTIGKLRRLSERGTSFTIETIPRVGYRLVWPDQPQDILERGPVVAAPQTEAAKLPPSPRAPPGRFKLRWSRARLAAWVIVPAVAFSALGAWLLSRPSDWTIDRFQVVVSTPLYENNPALSPNGAMIAYAAGPMPYAWHIFIRNLSDGQPIQLTDGAADDDMQPAWSPDGDKIAFVRHREGENCRIVVKPVPAGDERTVGRCRDDDFSSVAWSPQGNALYYSDRPDSRSALSIMRLDLATGGVTVISHPPNNITGDVQPTVSSNGRNLMFVRVVQGSLTRVVQDLAAGNVQTLPAPIEGMRFGQAFTKDNSVVATLGGLSEPSLWIYSANGVQQRLTLDPQEFGQISAGPKGLFAVEIYQNQTVLASPPEDGKSAPEVLNATTGLSYFPDFAADGRLAFAYAAPGGGWEIWTQQPGERPRQITSMGASYVCGVHWSPDGTRMIFFARIGKQHGVYVINSDGTGMRLLISTQSSTGWPAWTADSQGLIYAARDRIGWRLWSTTLAHPERAVPASDYGWFSVRTSGSALYASGTHAPGIWRIDGTPRLIANTPKRCTFPFVECESWFVSGDMLVFADHTNRAMPRFVMRSISTGKERTVNAPALDYSDEATLNPKTGKLLYVYDGLGGADIALFHLSRRAPDRATPPAVP